MLFNYLTDEENSDQKKFKVYFNYLKNISDLLEQPYYKNGNYLKEVRMAENYKAIGRKAIDDTTLRTLLRNAWFTEIQLNSSCNYKEFIPYANHWAQVQVYYAVYHALTALLISMNTMTNANHQAILKDISEKMKNRSVLLPYPFNIICTGDPKNKTISYIHLPGTAIVNKVSALKSNPQFLDSYCLFLKSTRGKNINKKRKAGIYKNKKKLQKGERKMLVDSVHATTIFDCLRRIREKANYKDVGYILSAVDNETFANQFNNSLRNVCNHLMLCIELLILKYVGRNFYFQLIDDFLDYVQSFKETLINRRTILYDVC